MTGSNAPPPRDFNIAGYHTDGYRLRTGFFGRMFLEEKRVYRDGTVKWRKVSVGTSIKFPEEIGL